MSTKKAKRKTATKVKDKTPVEKVIIDAEFPDALPVTPSKAKPKLLVEPPEGGEGMLPDHITRAQVVSSDLNEDIKKLEKFLGSEVYRSLPDVERNLLQVEKKSMIEHYNALVERIGLYTSTARE